MSPARIHGGLRNHHPRLLPAMTRASFISRMLALPLAWVGVRKVAPLVMESAEYSELGELVAVREVNLSGFVYQAKANDYWAKLEEISPFIGRKVDETRFRQAYLKACGVKK